MKEIAYYSGKIETKNRDCFIGDQRITCPGSETKNRTQAGDELDLLPPISSLDKRGDFIFSSISILIILSLLLLALFKVKILGRTLSEYLKPIWYFVLISILTVLWQYLFGLKINDNLMALRISQWVWEAMILLSAYKLSKIPGFSYGHMFFLGILYSLIIHGSKVAIRYYFYDKTLLYSLDRFLYGSLLATTIASVLGSVFVYSRKKRLKPLA